MKAERNAHPARARACARPVPLRTAASG